MALDVKKYAHQSSQMMRDVRPIYVRIGDRMRDPAFAGAIYFTLAASIYFLPFAARISDVIFFSACLYFWWLISRTRELPFKMPMGAKYKDPNNKGPGRNNKSEGILYMGNVDKTNEQVWFTNSDIRTHMLYLGTTGSGKTEGLKSMATNALAWGSGFVYVDGKADTDLWSSLSSMVRRFGRDDDLLVLNYMTGNVSDVRAPSNTMNPFSSGSPSYLTNMLVSLMPDAEGDNAMWKERAVALVGALMPALCWKRDNQDVPMNVSTIRDYLTLRNVIRLSREEAIPDTMKQGIRGYLDTLPGYNDDAYDDEGKEKPAAPGSPPYDTGTPSQQHGYLAMQFTRALQSLGDDYGYIFDAQAADVDMLDVVLNRRILVVLIPALEKSSDEIANLGKIVASTLKGMMGSTLGSTVEGESATVIDNKPTRSSTPFMTIFDEVGYYTAQGMAVMAAQARSLGFCLIYSGQDLPALEKRVKEEARSITANCNIKMFGKLEDPTQTKEFFEKTVGSEFVAELSGYQLSGDVSTGGYFDTRQANIQERPRATYGGLKAFTEGMAVVAFGDGVVDVKVFFSNPGHAKAMRVTRYVALPPHDEGLMKNAATIAKVRDRMVSRKWTAQRADVKAHIPDELAAIVEGLAMARDLGEKSGHVQSISALVAMHALEHDLEESANDPVDKAVRNMATIDMPKTVIEPPKPGIEPPQQTQSAAPFGGEAQSADPMSFFGAPGAAVAEETQPAQPAQYAQTLTEPPPSQAEAAPDDGDPMSFFGAPASKPVTPDAVEPEKAAILQEPPKATAQQAPPTFVEKEKPAQSEAPPVPDASQFIPRTDQQANEPPQMEADEDIIGAADVIGLETAQRIKAAGQKFRQSIFLSQDDNDHAAE